MIKPYAPSWLLGYHTLPQPLKYSVQAIYRVRMLHAHAHAHAHVHAHVKYARLASSTRARAHISLYAYIGAPRTSDYSHMLPVIVPAHV